MRLRWLLFAAIGTSAGLLCAQNPPKTVTEFVRTQVGFIRGQTDGQVDRFLGVPFAAPPVGDLRWKAPSPPQSWSGIRDATVPASECTQLQNTKNGQVVTGSEDCLYLNIYRPANARPRQLIPVFVFIHGGLNHRDSANDYDPTEMVAKTGIIVVTIDYRLNVFGFLALPSLDSEAGEPSSGNFGLLDQQAALRWVRDNILGFGGDPTNVTVGGESAGGIDLCANLASPNAAGLFHKVIMESLYCPAAPHDEALATSAPVAVAAGCPDPQSAAACLRSKSAADVLKAAEPLNPIVGGDSAIPGKGSGFNASPNFGNDILPLKPSDALASGQWNWSSVLLGSNHDEAALFVAPAMIGKVKLPLSVEGYQAVVGFQYGSFAPSVLAEYGLAHYVNPFIAYADEVTDDSPLGCALTPLSQTLSATTQTYRFEFDDDAAPTPGGEASGQLPGLSLGAYHGSELQYLFKMTKLPGPQTGPQQQLSEQMIQYWGNFVKTGNPNGSGLPVWPRYDADTRQILSLRPAGNSVIDDFDTDHHCAFWATAPGPPFK
ncbi:MAG TPA: carboxylesterase family protein [Bryobacteraceae bacterium]|jgi:para-nitrobenzyl esterase